MIIMMMMMIIVMIIVTFLMMKMMMTTIINLIYIAQFYTPSIPTALLGSVRSWVDRSVLCLSPGVVVGESCQPLLKSAVSCLGCCWPSLGMRLQYRQDSIVV